MKNNFESKFIQNLIHLNYGLRVKAEQIEGKFYEINLKLSIWIKSINIYTGFFIIDNF